jgi:hypothetical protein
MKIAIVIFFFLVSTGSPINAQYASRKLSKKQLAYTDSLKNVEYNYIFPILGQQAYSRGFDIPYPAGLMGNFIWMDQGIIMDNFQLGIKSESVDIPATPVDFIGFGENTNVSYATNFRPDIWVFPFLNVYGLFGYGRSTTTVNLVEPVELKSIVDQGMSTMGVGLMGAFGLGPLWLSVDANWTWTNPELLEDPVKVRVLGLRLGKSFVFSNHPERNIAIWAGGMRARMSSNTVGAIKMADAIPPETWDRLDEIDQQWTDYKVDHPGLEDGIFDQFIEALVNKEGNTIIKYAMDKRPVQEWNMVFGGQFQINKNWQIRTEAGLIGDRKSFLISLNYRFLL